MEFNKKYEVSNLGRVKNIETKNFINGGISGGYKSIVLNNNINGNITHKNFKVHILVARAFIENDDPKTKKICKSY